jgi:hypothetical protein
MSSLETGVCRRWRRRVLCSVAAASLISLSVSVGAERSVSAELEPLTGEVLAASGLPTADGDDTGAALGATAVSVHDTWRGWIQVTQTLLPSAYPGTVINSSVFVDTDEHGTAGLFSGINYELYKPDQSAPVCVPIAEKVAETLPAGGSAQLIALPSHNLPTSDHSLEVPTEMLVWKGHPAAGTPFPGQGRVVYPTCPHLDYDHEWGSGGLGGVGGIAWPMADYGEPPLDAFRSYSYIDDESGGSAWDVTVCMTRSTIDSDGDGLPDLVDLDPNAPASPLELGVPGGPATETIGGTLGPDLTVELLTPSCPSTPDCAYSPQSDPVVCYAPLVRLHPDETHFPMSADTFIDRSTLYWSRTGCTDHKETEDVDPGKLGSGGYVYDPVLFSCSNTEGPWPTNAYTRPGDPLCGKAPPAERCKDDKLGRATEGWYLKLDDDATFGEGTTAPMYYEYLPGESITYWFLWGFSKPSAGEGGGRLIQHQGDWEHIIVNLDDTNAAQSVTYWYHHWNRTVPWDDVPKAEFGTPVSVVPHHPVVYAALEGHGSYWTTACDFQEDPSLGLLGKTSDKCSAAGYQWYPNDLRNAVTEPWYGFGGAWGDVGDLVKCIGDTTGPPGPGASPLNGTVGWPLASCKNAIETTTSTWDTTKHKTFDILIWAARPNTPVRLWMFSTPVDLGTFTTDEDGSLAATVQLPTGTSPGPHTVQAWGYNPEGTRQIWELDITVIAAPPSFTGVIPDRLFETRAGEKTADGKQQAVGRRAAGQVSEVQIAGRGGVPADALAAVVNVTAIRPDEGGFVTVFPCGVPRPSASTLNYAPGQVVANGATIKLGASGKVCVYTHRAMDLIVDVTGYFPAGSSFEGVTPGRLFETRVGEKTVDGMQQAVGRREAGQVSEVQVAGRGGVPADALAAVVNVTAIRPDMAGFVTVFPCGVPRPSASTLNYAPGQVAANGATIKLGDGGKVCVYTHRAMDLIVDVTGYFPAGSSFEGVTPGRLFETRVGEKTVDGKQQAVGRRKAAQVAEVQVAGRGGVPADASAAVVNVTAIRPDEGGFVTVFPCGVPRPSASTLNYAPGQVVANGSTIKLGAGGKICVYTHRAMDLIVDVTGYFPAEAA